MKPLLLLFSILVIASASIAQIDRAKVHFADTTEAKKAIIDDSVQPFFSIMMPLEMIAKTADTFSTNDLDLMRQACRLRYRSNVQNFTSEEKDAILWYLDELSGQLNGEYPKLAALDWNFIKLNDQIEGGLPHTRGKYIMLSNGLIQFFINSIEKSQKYPNTKNLVMMQVAGLLVHEQLHVFQRYHPGIFDSIYINEFNFFKLKNKPLHPWITSHNVFNPDAPNIDWVKRVIKENDTSYIWPMVAIKDSVEIPKMPDDFMMIGLSLRPDQDSFVVITDSSGLPVYDYLLKIDGYYDGIPLIDRSLLAKEVVFAQEYSTAYHPEEALASLLTTIFGFERLPLNLMFEDNRRKFQNEADSYKIIFQKFLK